MDTPPPKSVVKAIFSMAFALAGIAVLAAATLSNELGQIYYTVFPIFGVVIFGWMAIALISGWITFRKFSVNVSPSRGLLMWSRSRPAFLLAPVLVIIGAIICWLLQLEIAGAFFRASFLLVMVSGLTGMAGEAFLISASVVSYWCVQRSDSH
jgi:hypothetical protein